MPHIFKKVCHMTYFLIFTKTQSQELITQRRAEKAQRATEKRIHSLVPTLRVGMQFETLCVSGRRSVPV